MGGFLPKPTNSIVLFVFAKSVEFNPYYYSAPDVLDFYGPINGADETYKIYSDNGNYDTKSKNLTMLGNVSVISKEGDVGTADKVVYNSETEIMDAYAINKDVVYKTKDGMIESKKVNFDNKTRELKIDTPFKFSDKDKNGTDRKSVV